MLSSRFVWRSLSSDRSISIGQLQASGGRFLLVAIIPNLEEATACGGIVGQVRKRRIEKTSQAGRICYGIGKWYLK